ncbi:sugar phosphate isomerase/epimerase family protein [Paenibacillus sp. EC2-1]|uniref:sugar phosphate isomerase/epimerase family protein n=1 Tax=Paenibacillus sp. EC2-1 TaxID=3388665 RepID=UPI003BEF096D
MTYHIENTDPANWKVGTYWDVSEGIDLADLKSADLDCVELTLRCESPRQVESVRQEYEMVVEQIRKFGLELWSVHIPFGQEWDISTIDVSQRRLIVDAIAKLIEIAAEWHPKHAIIHPSFEPIPSEEREERIDACRESLRELSEFSISKGIRLAAECLPRTCLANDSKELLALISDSPECGVCCDVNHLFLESPEDFIRKLGNRITTLHISDNDGMDEKHWIPGEGVIQWPEVVRALVEIGYNGTFLFEANYSEARELMNCYNYLLNISSGKDLS